MQELARPDQANQSAGFLIIMKFLFCFVKSIYYCGRATKIVVFLHIPRHQFLIYSPTLVESIRNCFDFERCNTVKAVVSLI